MFNEEKTTALAMYFISKIKDIMPYLKLIKLMYLADRKMIQDYNKPITGDTYVCMKLGPVLSNTYNLISENKDLESKNLNQSHDNTNFTWHNNIKTVKYCVKKNKKATLQYEQKLDSDEKQTIDSIIKEYGGKTAQELVDYLHDQKKFPEWTDPNTKGLIPIDIIPLLQILGKDERAIHKYLFDNHMIDI